MEHLAVRTDEKMKEVLMNPAAEGPSAHYYMIRGGAEQKNITVWEVGTVGGEYIKTYGHYHAGDLDETYDILFGQGVALLQKRAVDEEGNPLPDMIEEFRAVVVKAGDELHIPHEFGHLFANTGTTYLTTADNSPVNFDDKDPVSMPSHADYEPVKQMHGFAYYVIERNGAPALVKNSLYKEVHDMDAGGLEVIG